MVLHGTVPVGKLFFENRIQTNEKITFYLEWPYFFFFKLRESVLISNTKKCKRKYNLIFQSNKSKFLF